MSGYDENLLKQAPEATREERQEGYNIDILNQQRTASPPVSSGTPRAPSAPPPSFPPAAGAAAGESDAFPSSSTPVGGAKEYSSVSQDDEAGRPRSTAAAVPFWRTTRGKLLIALLVLIVIGAVVGGAVGGTVGKSSSNSSKTSSSIPPVSPTSTTVTFASGGSTITSVQQQFSTSRTSSIATTDTGGAGADTSTGSVSSVGAATDNGPNPSSTITTPPPAGTAGNAVGKGVVIGGPQQAGSDADRRRKHYANGNSDAKANRRRVNAEAGSAPDRR